MRELEAELEQEQRRYKDALAAAKRFERQWKEVLVLLEEEKHLNAELHDLLEKMTLKVKQYKRQMDEAVCPN